jgi:hypothetical protein
MAVHVLFSYTECHETASSYSGNVKPLRGADGSVEWKHSKEGTPALLLVALIVLPLAYSSLAGLLAFATLPAQSPGDCRDHRSLRDCGRVRQAMVLPPGVL